jgi:transcriptional regulator with XRE-family HTH domain
VGGEAERYNFIREKSGLSKKDFAESLGLSMVMGFQIATGRIRPSCEVMERLSSVYNVNLHWFITGEGSPGYNPDTVEIELLDQEAAAGRGQEVVDYPEKHSFQVPRSLVSPYRPERLQAVYVAGDSMADEKINDGDIVIFHPGLTGGERRLCGVHRQCPGRKAGGLRYPESNRHPLKRKLRLSPPPFLRPRP